MATEKTSLVVPGYVSAVVFPIVGFIVGIVLATRSGRAARHGVAVMCIAVLATVAWAAVIAHERQQQQAQVACVYSSTLNGCY